MIETTLRKNASDLDGGYRNIGRYLVDYMRVKDKLYSIDVEEAISVMDDIRTGDRKRK